MLTKNEFASFRLEIEQALKAIAEKYNSNIKAGKINYTTNSFDLKLEVSRKEVNGKSFEQAEFEKNSFLYGFKPEDYGKNFNISGKTFTLYGFKRSARTMPVLARGMDGKNYKFGTEIKKLLI